MTPAPRVVVELNEERVAVLTLNRPEARNALDLEMVQALERELRNLSTVSDLAALIVTGAGEKAFVAGADIAELRERRAPEAFQRINQGLFRRVEEFPAPTIAAVRGWALGGGCELALACDLRVAGKSARFGQPEVGLGIIPGAGGTHRLAKLIGIARAKELVFTGENIGAQRAHELGLVNHVTDDSQVLEKARELASIIAKQSIPAVRLAKLALTRALDLDDAGRDLVEVLAQAICFESEDKFQRMTRFLERKKKSP